MKIVDRMTYQDNPDNIKAVIEFVGDKFWNCSLCGGSGEYELDDGPHGCMLCNSRLIPFVNADDEVVTADWGDDILKDEYGRFHLRRNNLYS